MDNLDYKVDKPAWHKYGDIKAGNVFMRKRQWYKGDGLISVVSEVMLTVTGKRTLVLMVVQGILNPGNLKTPLQRHVPGWQMVSFQLDFAYPDSWGIYRVICWLVAGCHAGS